MSGKTEICFNVLNTQIYHHFETFAKKNYTRTKLRYFQSPATTPLKKACYRHWFNTSKYLDSRVNMIT